ncbi:MAG TPA: class I SAM-dependent methyltransferase [Acidimicrobiia bacterium]|nr:class I SAM-dependent methyltransferase [Acidimicrobiia bacterium]
MRKAGFEGALAAAERLSGRRAFLTSYPIDPQPRWGWGQPANAALEALLARDLDLFEAARKSVGAHLDFLASIPAHGGPTTLHWDNDFWGALDAGFQCASLIDRAPANYVEVGSGYSTMFARRTIERHGLPTRITSIDPAPRAEVDALCDRVVRSPVQDVDPELFTALSPGDIVLFDGSHEAYTGADTVVMLLDLLPALPPGVLVGIDDVFLPWDYPADWTRRFYAEQYLLAAYLLGGAAGACVVLPAFYLTRADDQPHELDACAPRLGSFGKSFWLERTGR